MPRALRTGPYRLYFYSYDCAEPRHMHADRENRSAKFWLDPDASLETNHGYSLKSCVTLSGLCARTWSC
jgi:Domain of unknown function (DUF4160)